MNLLTPQHKHTKSQLRLVLGRMCTAAGGGHLLSMRPSGRWVPPTTLGGAGLDRMSASTSTVFPQPCAISKGRH
jgi:hypothetical protein